MTNNQMKNEIQKFNNRNATAFKDIPAKILKNHSDTVAPYLGTIYENSKQISDFPDGLKEADVTPVFKKDDNTNKENYRPVSILPTVSKIYERRSNLLIYWKGLSTQYSIASMVENWKKCLDNTIKAGAILTDLSKAFDCLKGKSRQKCKF